jgi:hypothetical protein
MFLSNKKNLDVFVYQNFICTYMREGGKALFLMPSKLAYRSAGYYSIPGYTSLLFEVDLVKMKKR